MPESHEPQAEGAEEAFKPSVPDLRPSLETEETEHEMVGEIGTGNPARGLASRFEINGLGATADELNDNQNYYAEEAQGSFKREKELSQMWRDTFGATQVLEHTNSELEPSQPDNLMQQFVLAEAIKILNMRKDEIALEQQKSYEKYNRASDAADATLYRSGKHFQANEEACKNQATMDYMRAREADPEKYPEPLNYPPITDGIEQPPSTSQPGVDQTPPNPDQQSGQ